MAVFGSLMKLAALAAFIAAAAGQPFEFQSTFVPGETEAAQRHAVNYTGFVFDFDTAKKTDGGTPNGSLRSNQITQNPFLETLPGPKNGQTVVTLGPCSGNTIHTHPRGSEISFVTAGKMLFGMIEENQAKVPGNTPVLRMIEQGQTIHIPQGLVHFSHNMECKPAQFLANFATDDPGTQTVWHSLLAVPDNVLHLSTGIPEETFRGFRREYPLAVAPGTGGEECLRRCNLTFAANNAFAGYAKQPVLPPAGPPISIEQLPTGVRGVGKNVKVGKAGNTTAAAATPAAGAVPPTAAPTGKTAGSAEAAATPEGKTATSPGAAAAASPSGTAQTAPGLAAALSGRRRLNQMI